MTLIEALALNRPIRLPGVVFYLSRYPQTSFCMTAESWKDPEWFLSVVHLTKEDILSTDWEVKPEDSKL